MMRAIAHVDEMLELSGPTAPRDVLRAAPPMFAIAKIAGIVRGPRAKVSV